MSSESVFVDVEKRLGSRQPVIRGKTLFLVDEDTLPPGGRSLSPSPVAAHKATSDQRQSLILTLVYKHWFLEFTSDH